MRALIECTKGTKTRYEVLPTGECTHFDVKKPWVANYGFIKDTLQADGDALDCYVLGKKIESMTEVDVAAIACIVCFDGDRRDDKVICVPVGYKVRKSKVKSIVRKLVRTIRRFSKGTVIIGVRYSPSWLYYQLVKCHVYKELFCKGE